MRVANSIVAAAFIVMCGSARAEAALISPNYVDDFGSLSPGSQPATPAVSSNANASTIPSNGVDQLGTDHPTPNSDSHYEEEAGSGGGEPQPGEAAANTESRFLQDI